MVTAPASGGRDSPEESFMPTLTKTQSIILSATARRDNRLVLPLPENLQLNAGSKSRVLKSLLKRGLIDERIGADEDPPWVEHADGQRTTLIITESGIEAVVDKPEIRSTEEANQTHQRPGKHRRKKSELAKDNASAGKGTPLAVRSGTKQAVLVDLLRRDEGTTVAEIMAATNWQAHSVRGAISGSVKKKLGLIVQSETEEGRGRVYRIIAKD
jgi:DNA-binding MarR family transcriptional regulator